jgi:hypothetical protein
MTDEHIDSYLDAVRCLNAEASFRRAQTAARIMRVNAKDERSQTAFMIIVAIGVIFTIALICVQVYVGS